MRGAFRGSMGTVGGMGRTFGLHHHFSGPDVDRKQGLPARRDFGRIARYFRPYLKQWIVILLCVAVAAGLHVIPPFCVRLILDDAIPEQDSRLLAMLAAAMVGLAMVTGLIGVLQQSLTAKVGQSIMFDVRNQLYRHLQRMSLHFYTSNRSGEIVSRISNDVNAVQGVATGTVVSIASNIATLTATSIALISMNWRLTLLAVLVVPAFYLPSRLVGRVRRRLSTQTQGSQAALMGFLNERLHVGGALLSNIFGRRDSDAGEFSERSQRVRELSVRQAVVGRWLFMILSVFSSVGPALIYWYGGLQVMSEGLTAGQLVAFAALLALLYRPLVQLASVYVDIQAAVAVFGRIFEYLDLVPAIRDKPDARHLERPRGRVRFESVGFSYPALPAIVRVEEDPDTDAPEKKRFALQDVSFEIPPGSRVALVGPSGSGKTTTTYLLPRFYDADAGRITLDGVDLRDIAQDDIRRHIGMVTQETFLFHASLRENLLYAAPDADAKRMEDACRAANIHEFIAGLPDGYDTVVGERGFRLSGGEKQRVSIARALLKDPAILILDEATSSLDATSEYLIQSALEVLLQGRTSLIIAHRLSTILGSDAIVVMDAGRVLDIGRHEELLSRDGLYARLFAQQFAKVLGAETRMESDGARAVETLASNA